MTTTPTSLTFPILAMPFTDSTNTAHPNACWYLATINQDAIDLAAGLVFYGYDTPADLVAVIKSDLTGGPKISPIGQKSYPFSMPQFAQFASTPGAAGATLMGSEFTDAVGLAQSVLDTPAPPNADGSPALNADGTAKMVSFFAGATVSSVTVTL